MNFKRKTQDKYSVNYHAFSKWNEFTAYVLGFTMADGYLKRNYGQRRENSWQFELAEYDRDILDKIVINLNYEGKVRISKRHTAKLAISNVKLIDDLIQKGIPVIDKTKNAFFSPNIPVEFINDFIRGLFDGDGFIYKDNGILTFQLLGTKKLLSKIKDVLENKGAKNVAIYNRNKNGTNIF